MPLFLDLRNGRSARDLSSSKLGFLGPVVGPFLSVRLLGDAVRVATPAREFALQRIGDWIFYDDALYADAEIIAQEQVGPRRKRRMCAFDPALGDISSSDFSDR
jgi:hypothetical protein